MLLLMLKIMGIISVKMHNHRKQGKHNNRKTIHNNRDKVLLCIHEVILNILFLNHNG